MNLRELVEHYEKTNIKQNLNTYIVYLEEVSIEIEAESLKVESTNLSFFIDKKIVCEFFHVKGWEKL